MLWERKVAQCSAAVRARAKVPARLSLWGGQSYDSGTFDRLAVTVHAKSPAAMPLLLDLSLDSLGEAYIKQKIDLDGRLADIIDIAYAMGNASIGKPTQSAMGGALLHPYVRLVKTLLLFKWIGFIHELERALHPLAGDP